MKGCKRALILSVQVPYVRGGAEILCDRLAENLRIRGIETDIVQLPVWSGSRESVIDAMSMWRSLELSSFGGKDVDLVIATKFPTYLVRHSRLVVWLIHQHRQAYDLYGTAFGDLDDTQDAEALRRIIHASDCRALSQAHRVFTISSNVAHRLKLFNGVDAKVIEPPLPLGDRYESRPSGNYILSVGRLCRIKRADLIVRAMARIVPELSLKIVGVADEPEIEGYLRSEIEKHHLAGRVQFLGRVSDEKLLGLFAESFGVFYAPFDEDYGFVTLEALRSGKPVITTGDSGGVLDYVKDGVNGVVAAADYESIAGAINDLFGQESRYQRMCQGARTSVTPTHWDEVIEQLTED